MVKKVLALLLIVSSVYTYAQTRPGSLRGTVTEVKTGETLPAVNIIVKDEGGNKITGGSTDFDGQYNINPIAPGTYNVEVSSIGYATINLNGVIISPNSPTIQDFKMQEQTTELTEVEIIYERPLIDKSKTSTVVDAEDIVNMPVRDVTSIAAQAAGVTQNANGGTNIRGAREEGTVYFIDGVKVRGSVSIPQAAIQQTEVITGGLPAQYGDAVGGVISTTTKGPSPEYFGSVEILTSTPLELISTKAFGDYDYNLGAVTFGGPLYKNDAGIPIVGFLFSSEFLYVKENRPGSIPYVKIDEDVLRDIEANPIAIDPSGQSIIYRSEFVTDEDLSDIPYQQNAYDNEVRLNGNIQIKTSRTTNLTVGGRWTYSNDKLDSYGNHIFNYENNLDQISSDWSTYVRFQQQFGESDENALIKNAFYNIQVDYTRNKDKIFDRHFGDDFFKYGHVGYYDVNELPAYVYGTDTVTGYEGWRYVGNAPIGVDFTPGEYNAVRGNYVSRYYDLAAENQGLSTLSINALKGAGIPVNGTNPRSVYGGLWGSPGSAQSVNTLGVQGANYYKTRNSQFRVTASTNFDIKDHSLIVGIEYEQRSDRAYALDASSLWQRMELFQNSAIQQLDLNSPILVTDENGVYQDTINYPRLYSPDDASQIDRNIRLALGMDPQSTELINIHNLDPNLFSVDMFAPDELINPGGIRYVGYYGFDYAGNVLDRQPSISDFYSERDENGRFTRPVGAFQPIYIAGYIQDQFTFNDLTFNVGVRVDRFDLNQQVLRDPYVLYPTYSVRDLASSGLSSEAIGDVPSSVGGDYVVYVSSFDYGTASIVGYRDPESNQWFNEAGEPINDPIQLAEAAGGGIKPLLVSPPSQNSEDTSGTAGNLTAASFKDYDPQTVVMPRVAFNFPITDEALFIAHYDVLAQRPTSSISRLDPFDYLDLHNKRANNPLNNPDLRPQKTTEYELGFKQALTDRSALKISAFYRELRDLIQTVSFTQAYPLQYVAYGNLDYGTVKGFSLEYELRRTNNVKLDANYTLQFADGTGSGPNSGLNLASNGQPNLRYILPLSFDNRHQIMVRFDYRYGRGNRYNGPVWWNSRVFENAGINITMNALSGTPYTRRDAPYPLTTGNPSSISQVTGQINGSRLPWTVTFDARINKVFSVSKGNNDRTLEVYLQILNLFDIQNIVNVYPFTGSPDDDGYLASSAAQTQIQQQVNSQAYVDLYNRRMMSPFNYGLPRRVRLGIAYNF